MYIEEVSDLRISMRDSPAFSNLILDFTITSPSLSAEYKVNLQPHVGSQAKVFTQYFDLIC